MKALTWIGAALTLSIPGAALASVDDPSAAPEITAAERKLEEVRRDLEVVETNRAEAERRAAEATDTNPPPGRLAGFGLAAGIGVVHLDDPEIADVTLENGIVRVGSEEDTINGFWLETHYTFAKGKYAVKEERGKSVYRNRAFFHGPFLGVQVTDGADFLKTVGLGYMMSLKRNRDDPEDKGAFNLGLGICNTQVHELIGGAADGEPLPEGMESPQLRQKNVLGGMLVFSFTFL